MTRYYDIKCQQCEECHFHKGGNYPNGTPYECCRWFGYILHPEKGISDEPCEGFMTEEKFKELEQMKEMQKKKKKYPI